MMNWYGGGMGAGGFAWFLMIPLWAGLIGLISYLVVKLLPGSGTRDRPAASAVATPLDYSPEQVLDRVFALGEIDEETYRARRRAMIEARGSS